MFKVLFSFLYFQSSASHDLSDQSDDDSEKPHKSRSHSRAAASDSDTDDSDNQSKSDDDSMSDSSQESKSAVNDKSSVNSDSSDEESKKAMDRINNDSSDSVTPPPPKLTPVKKRGRPPGSLNKPKHLLLPHLHSLKQRGRGAVGRPRGIGRGRSLKRGFGRGLSPGRGSSKAASLLKTIGRGISSRSPGKVLRGRGGVRGRGMRGSALNKIRMKSGRPPGRPRKVDKNNQSNEKNTPKSINSPKDLKSMKFFSHLKMDKSSPDNDRKWDSMGALEGVSILEHEPDSLDEEYDDDEDDDFYNGDSDSLMERSVDLRNYWIPPTNVKSLLDQVCITDVTTNSGTITFRECTSDSGFFNTANGSHS